MGALNEGRGDLFATTKSLALFVNALHESDQQFVALNNNLATLTSSLNNSDQELAQGLVDIDSLLTTARRFVDDNGSLLATDINNLADVTNALMQPGPRNGLETALHVYPNLAAKSQQHLPPAHGGLISIPAIASWANPMQFLCSAIQAGSRLGYQDSAELCAEYLAPILDATKFNYPPFGSISSPAHRRCRSTSPTPRSGCVRRRATRTPRFLVSGRVTPCSRTGTMNRAGSSHPECRALKCNRSPRTCSPRIRWQR